MSKSREAKVVNMVHECDIYAGGSVVELGYVIPKLLRIFFQSSICDSYVSLSEQGYGCSSDFNPDSCYTIMTRNSKLNTGIHNQHFLIEPQ